MAGMAAVDAPWQVFNMRHTRLLPMGPLTARFVKLLCLLR